VSLAATLYVLLVGETPGQLSTVRKYEYSIDRKDPLPTAKQQNPNLSDRINEAIIRGMAIEPQNRPKSMQEWLKLLKEKVITEPLTSRTLPELKTSKKSIDRKISPTVVTQQNQSPLVQPTPPKPNPAETRLNRRNNLSVTVTRRNWLKYSSLAIAAMGITWMGKNIWENSSQQSQESDSSLDLTTSSSVNTNSSEAKTKNLKLTEYQFDVITVNDKGEEIKREAKDYVQS
jgi:hypothetical protein